MDIQGAYRADFEYGYEIDHHPKVRTGTVQFNLVDGIVEGNESDLVIDGVYEIVREETIHMDLIAKPQFWDPVKKGEARFVLHGNISSDTWILTGPTGDDPRLFIRAKCTRFTPKIACG